MRITILAVGSRGDVQPCVALGEGLLRAGHDVLLAASPNFRELAVGRGLTFAALGEDSRILHQGEQGRDWMENSGNPLSLMLGLSRLLRPAFERLLAGCWSACADAEAVIYSPLAFGGPHIAEKLGIPSFAAWPFPMSRTRMFPSFGAPPNRKMGPRLTYLTHVLGEQVYWLPFRKEVNRWRESFLGLPAVSRRGILSDLHARQVPFLYGYSPSVLPPPRDWPSLAHVTGYWFLDAPAGWRPPAALESFLKAGPPPVYFGFGSMTPRDMEKVTRMVLLALKRTGQRGILVSGWGDLGNSRLPDDVLKVDEVPHDWLFPRMAAVVHHGGAGTTAAGLRAGVPSVVTPLFADQPFWAQRVYELGVGPRWTPFKQVSAEWLEAAIRTATSDAVMRRRAAALGERIRAEDGVGQAVEVVHRHLRERSHTYPRLVPLG